MSLAIHGGQPIRSRPWAYWPPAFDSTALVLQDVVSSRRWTATGVSMSGLSFDSRFRSAFAKYLGTTSCVTACNGTAALRLALEGLGVGTGDEVIVPALTWVADVDAVLS